MMEATLWPYGKCQICANKNYCVWSEKEILNCMENGYCNYSTMTQADRIRAMTDEELAKKMSGLESFALTCGRAWPPESWLEWLRQEVNDA